MKRPVSKTPALRRLPPVRRNGVALLDHLAENLGLSRRAAKNLLDDRLVFVNGRRIWMAKHLLQTRDAVELLPDAVAPKSETAAAIRILLDDPKFLVADKPPRLLTVGEKSLEVRLRDQLGLPGLRAVHRLDKDTSGCVLFAKDEETRAALVAQFEEGRVRKLYHALVAGNLAETQMDVRVPVDHLPAVSHVRQVAAQTKPPRRSSARGSASWRGGGSWRRCRRARRSCPSSTGRSRRAARCASGVSRYRSSACRPSRPTGRRRPWATAPSCSACT